MKIRLPLLIFLLILFQISFAQKETNWWYFGNNAGISFTGSGGTPVAQTNGKLNCIGGTASISDSKGNLLFYTDGETVYDRTHSVMTNGSGLNGSNASTQSSIIIQQPGRGNRYYIFTTDKEWGNNGFQYSIVDTNYNGGKGQVIQKNVKLLGKCAEKVSAVNHANGVDVWVATHSAKDNKFYVYKISSSGISSPVVSSAGPNYDTSNIGYAKGALKFSHDGTMLVSVVSGILSSSGWYNYDFWGRAELYYFDNISGVVSERYIFDGCCISGSNYSGVYGAEFSPDNMSLYISFYRPGSIWGGKGNDGLYGSKVKDWHSKSGLNYTFNSLDRGHTLGGMQIGADGIFYVMAPGYTTLSAVKPTCGSGSYTANYTSLSGKYCQYGIPNFNASFFNKPLIASSSDPSNLCENSLTKFYLTDSAKVDSAVWTFDDPSTGSKNIARGFSVTHQFSSAKTYNINLKRYNRFIFSQTCEGDSVRKTITIFPYPKPNIGCDTAICDGTYIILADTTDEASWVWKGGSKSSNYNATTKGWYWVDAKVGGCTKRDSMFLDIIPNPKFSLGKDTTYCHGDSVKLTAYDGQKYLWNNGKTTASIFSKDTGKVWATAFKGYCESTDTVKLKNAFVSADYIIDNPGQCFRINEYNFKESIIYIGDNRKQSIWYFYDGSTINDSLATRAFPNAGTYTIKLIAQSKMGCKDSISKTVKVYPQTKVEFTFIDSIQCFKGNKFDFINTTKDTGAITYAWDLGDKTFANTKDVKEKTYSKDSIYKVKLVSTTFNNCRDSFIKNVKILKNPTANFTHNLACHLTPVMFQYIGSKPITTFQWNFNNEGNSGVENPSKLFNSASTKTITLNVISDNGCEDSISKNINVNLQPKADFIAKYVCEGDTTFFINKSTNADNYKWKFWDGNRSTLESPKHLFIMNGIPQNFNVTLVSYNNNGCKDSIVKSAEVNGLPKSSFNYTSISGSTINLKADQTGNTYYRWLFDGKDSIMGTLTPSHKFTNKINICLKVINAAGCISETCKEINIGSIQNRDKIGFKIYPNPNNGNFAVEIENYEKEVSIEIYNSIGELVEKVERVGKITSINLDMATGIYLVKVRNGEIVYSQKVSVIK